MPRPVTHYAPEHAATKTACGRDIVLFPVPTVVSRKPGPVDCSKCELARRMIDDINALAGRVRGARS